MKPAFHVTGSFWTVLAIGVMGLSALGGCENPGPVGNTLPGSESELVVDTMSIDSITVDELNPYSGQRTYLSLGRYDDPLFGSMSASAYLKPTLPSTTTADTMEENTGMKLRMIFDGGQAYGDSLEPGSYDIYEIDQIWRGNSWRLKNQAALDESYSVGSFILEEEDSLDVSLNSRWVDRYRSHFESADSRRDSLYRNEFHGLAVVPRDNSKILPLEAGNVRFVIENPDADTFQVSTGQWAFSLNREGEVSYPEGTGALFSTYEQVMSFDLNLEEADIPASNISKAEILFYAGSSAMEQSLESESATTVRPLADNLQLHLVDPAEVPDNIDPGNPIVTASYDEANNAYRFDITSFARALLQDQINPDQRLYLTALNNGTVKSTLLHLNDASQPARNPQIIVTSVKNINSTN